jgi:hypothetical protein
LKLEETLTPLAVFYLWTRMFLETPAASSSVIESSKSEKSFCVSCISSEGFVSFNLLYGFISFRELRIDVLCG